MKTQSLAPTATPAPTPKSRNTPKKVTVNVTAVPSVLPSFADDKAQAYSIPRPPVVHFQPAPPVTYRRDQALKKPILPDTEEIIRRGREEQVRQLERHLLSIVRIVGQACIEVELGMRSSHQLDGWLTLDMVQKTKLRAGLRKIARNQQPQPKHVKVISAGLQETPSNAYEAHATVVVGHRIRAIAMRLERHRNRWRVNSLEMG